MLWSPLSAGLSLLLLSPLATSCLWQSTTVRDLLPIVAFSLNTALFPLSPLLFLKGLLPFNNTVTDTKEATPLKLNSVVTKQNRIIESRTDVGLLAWGYKCCRSHPWIKCIVLLKKNLFPLRNLLVDWRSFLETTLTCIVSFQWNIFGQESFPISSLLEYSSCLTESCSSALQYRSWDKNRVNPFHISWHFQECVKFLLQVGGEGC